MKTPTHRIFFFILFSAAVITGVACYAVQARARAQRASRAATIVPASEAQKARAQIERGYLAFRNTALGPNHGCLSFVPLESPETVRISSKLLCDRVSAINGGGIALQASRKVFTTYRAVVFDAESNVKSSFNLAGAPSRARMAPDGKYAATTVFVTGDSYASAGFSTRTTIFDLQSAMMVADLEQFSVEMNGRQFKKVDFNFWGVTFLQNSDEFYATLSTGGIFYLVKGSVSRQQIKVIRQGVECPSLSPDETRIAYKARESKGGRLIWRLRILDLASGKEKTVNEDRSVDDQAEWLDVEHVLYGLPRNVAGSASSDIWVARADGLGTPKIFVHDGWSPSVVRNGPAPALALARSQ